MVAAALLGVCGVVSGVALGAVVGPIGVVLGSALGVGVGLAAGHVLLREEAKKSLRTRELDAIIGITSGSLGVGGVGASLPHASARDADDTDAERTGEPPAYSSREAWAAEWLTPPPPMAR